MRIACTCVRVCVVSVARENQALGYWAFGGSIDEIITSNLPHYGLTKAGSVQTPTEVVMACL